jgi:hypothetical protein
MKLRVVAIPLFAAICLASPTITSGEQAQRGRGYRPREGGGATQTAEKSGGDNNRGGGERTAGTNSRPAERRAETRTADRDNDSPRTASTGNNRAEQRRGESRTSDRDDNERYAVPKTYNAVVNSPRTTSRDYRDRDDYSNIRSSYRGGHYAPVHYDYWARRYYPWSPIGYVPWGLISGSIGFANFGAYGTYYGAYGAYGGAYGAPYAHYAPYAQYAPGYAYDFGGVRLRIRPREAQVFIDGYYAGRVDDFDGTFQSLKLEAGGHKIEVRMPGFEDLELDVHVQPGRTITLEEFLRPRP